MTRDGEVLTSLDVLAFNASCMNHLWDYKKMGGALLLAYDCVAIIGKSYS